MAGHCKFAQGRCLTTLPASGDPNTSGYVKNLVWDTQGHGNDHSQGQSDLLVCHGYSPARLDRLKIDNETGQILMTTNLHTELYGPSICSVSVNNRGVVGAVICYKGINFISPEGSKSDLWSPSPPLSGLRGVVVIGDVFCVYSEQPQSLVYRLEDKSPVTSIPLNNKENIFYITAIDGDRLVGIERNTGALYLVDVGNCKVTRIVPDFGGERILSNPQGVSCDGAGRIYVCDYDKHKVFVFTPEGEFVDALAGEDLGAALRHPCHIAVRSGQCPLLALSECNSKEVKVFKLEVKEK